MQPPLPVEDADRAVFLADRYRPRKQLSHAVGRGGGGHIEVGLFLAEEGVPQRSAHAPRLETRRRERRDDLPHLVGHVHVAGDRHAAAPKATPAASEIRSSMRACDGVRGPAGIAPSRTSWAPPPSKA